MHERVHIICIPWVIDLASSIERDRLECAIYKAEDQNIPVFCPVPDKGHYRRSGESPFPAYTSLKRVFRIHAWSGDQPDDPLKSFGFPGETPNNYEQRERSDSTMQTSSSIATGIAGLILFCAQLAEGLGLAGKEMSEMQRYRYIERAFEKMRLRGSNNLKFGEYFAGAAEARRIEEVLYIIAKLGQ
jgi:hypothetical protein